METYVAIGVAMVFIAFLAFKVGQSRNKSSGSGGGGGTKNPRPPKQQK